MGTQIMYGLLLGTVKLLAIFPLPVLYILSDLLYFLIYRVARYRLKVLRRNMRNSFPEKTDKELRRMERKFYRHFADFIVEVIKLAHISQEELLRRACIRNPEIIRTLTAQGHTCFVLLLGHYGNWEWFTGTMPFFDGATEIHLIYRPLKNQAFDRLFLYLRCRFHARCIRKNEAFRDILRLKRSGDPNLIVFLADQTPSKANLHYWTTFLNQETAVLTGAERIAVKLNLPVIYADMQKSKRGYYTVDFELITDTPKDMPEFRITEVYARKMEQSILREPACWFWTHKRWKYEKKQ